VCDRLIFDELSLESVLEIYCQEAPEGIILAMGGQASNNLALKLAACGVNILGTQAASIDCAEDRQKFSALLDRLSIPQPRWAEVSSLVEVEKVMAWLDGYPVLIRPSYVLSGAGMRVAHNQDELQSFLARAVEVSREHPVVLSKFESEAREFECDAVADSGEVVLWAVSEHLENAGIHSGDATLVCPPQGLSLQTINRARAITELLACALHITGPFNVQLLARDHEVKVIECNLRASRSFPFISKTLGINFIREATRLMLHMPASWSTAPNMLALPYVAVKVPQFSFNRIKGTDPRSGVEMASTGEVGCFGRDVEEALAKAMLATGYRVPSRSILLDVPSAQDLTHLTTELVRFAQNQGVIFTFPASTRRLAALGLTDPVVQTVADDDTGSGSVDLLRAKGVDLVISIPNDESPGAHQTGRVVRRAAVDWGVPLLTDVHVARYFLAACTQHHVEALEVKPYGAYLEPTPEQDCFNGLPALWRADGEQVRQGRPPLRLFIRQSFTECGWQEQQVVQSVLDVLQHLNGKPHPFDIVTGSAAHSRDNFRSVFQHETGLAFTPSNFRHHRLSLLRHADAMLVVRTGLSESGAFEVAYNLFKGKNVPMFFAIWRQSPIKTTLLRELHDLSTVVYVDFEHPEELRKPLRNFLSLVAHSTMGAAVASHDTRQEPDGVEVWDRVPLVELRLNRTGALRNR